VFKDSPKLISAVQAFCQNLTARGQPLPASVSLRELISSGYLAASDIRAFDGMDVTISLAANENTPLGALIWARLPDGSINALLADGSVQQVSPRRFEKYLEQSGQTSAPTDGSQPNRSETNGTPSAAGSRR